MERILPVARGVMRKADVALNIETYLVHVCNGAAHIDKISYLIEKVKHNIDKIYSSLQRWPLCLSALINKVHKLYILSSQRATI